MRRIKRFNLLGVFGDMKPKAYDIAVQLGSLHFANPLNKSEIWGSEKLPNDSYMSTEIEKMIKQFLSDGLLQRVENNYIKKIRLDPSYQIAPRDWDIQLTEKGRECLGAEQVARNGDYSWYDRSGFDGTVDKASKINPGLF